jgi:hypothetical protein
MNTADHEQAIAEANLLGSAINDAVARHFDAMVAKDRGGRFVISVLIGGLLNELARVIAAGPAPLHRAQIEVVQDRLPAIVAEFAVANNAASAGRAGK